MARLIEGSEADLARRLLHALPHEALFPSAAEINRARWKNSEALDPS